MFITYSIYNKDCLEFIKRLPDKSIDITITDPPYGKRADKGTNGFGVARARNYRGGWDNDRPPKQYFDELFRVSKNVIIFGANYFCDMLPPSNHWIFWDKKGDIKFQNPFADGELIYTSFKKPIRRIVFKQQGFISDSKDARYHPTQKPSELITFLIEQYTDDGQTVFDPFMGSGTTGIACINTNRNFIGIEIDEQFFNIAKQRIETAYSDDT